MKYIDADLLREKIAEQMKSLPREVGRGAGTITPKGYGMMEAFQIVRSIIDSLQQEQPEYGYLSIEYIHGKKSRWNVGDVLAYYISTSNEEGEYLLGKIVNVEFDEEEGWVYTFEDELVWDEQTLVEEGAYKKN